MSKIIFTGIAKRIEMSKSKGNRYKLIIDDIELADDVKTEIDDSVLSNKIDSKKPILRLYDFIRNEKIEVRV